MTIRFTINGTKYWIDEFHDGFAWLSCDDEGPSFPTALEAQQDAIRNERMIRRDREAELAERLEDEMHGTYEQQRDSLYQYLIRH